MKRKYENPPVKEVICEFRFDQSSTWDPTIPGLIYDKIKSDFPHRERGRDIETHFEIGDNPENLKPRMKFLDRAIFSNPDKNIQIQIGIHDLVINHMPPYSSWDEFQKVIDLVVDTYKNIAEPEGIERIELRYINEIPQTIFEGSDSVDLEDFFNFYPMVGKELPQDYQAFIVGIETQFDEGKDILRLQLTNSDKFILLDLHHILNKPNSVSTDEIFIWLDKAHSRIEQSFEGCLKDKLRRLFKEVD